jgi:hypothetical protein
MIFSLRPFFLLLSLITASRALAFDGFQELKRSKVPREAIDAICKDLEGHPCWNEFLEEGKAYGVDVNDDGKLELLLHVGFQDSGSGGEGYALVQKQGEVWKEIDQAGGWQFYHVLRLRKLDKSRVGYHDLRLGRTLFVKWDGTKYVPYAQIDYKNLSASLFNLKDPEDAEILWLIRHLGQNDFIEEQQWISQPSRFYPRFKGVKDPIQKIDWVSDYKGGVWGQDGNRAFLLLPRSSYLGATDMHIEGEWLLIYGDDCLPAYSHEEIARYQLRLHQLKLAPCLEIPYPAN